MKAKKPIVRRPRIDAAPPPAPVERGKRWQWEQTDKGTWLCDNPPAKITSMPSRNPANRSFSVHVNRDYWGAKPTLEEAQAFAKGARPPRAPMWDEPGFAAYAERHKAGEQAARAQVEEDTKKRKANTAKNAAALPTVEQEQRTRAKVAAAVTGANTRITGFKPTDTINVKNRTNPRKKGTGQWDRYEVILKYDGKTVQDYTAGGGDIQALKYAAAQAHVAVSSS